ncbi:MAG: Co2+/Mg2+ efflux protein ApaG [Bacteroidetes bacterium]|nr:MAG: Co2+/Mg2+ efflux protein ApaG [Bacteroidota bacterium]
METIITNGIKVSVESFYLEKESQPRQGRFAFGYKVRIENLSSSRVQLLARHWFISDSDGTNKEVEGEGVVGQMPVLTPGQSYEYTSWCPLNSEIGKMQGFYIMKVLNTGKLFRAAIPEFKLIAPHRCN